MRKENITGEARKKRSSKVVLTTMAALGGGALLSGCGEASAEQMATAPQQVASAKDGVEVQLFENDFACAKATGKPFEECAAMREEAQTVAKNEAPRFEAIHDCEQQFGEGKCVEDQPGEETTTRRRSFVPFVMGYLLGNSKSRPVPAFSSPGGGYQTSRGVRLGYAGAPGKYYASTRAFQPARSVPKIKPASVAAKSAGFGETSRGWKLASRAGGAGTASASRGG